MSPPPRRVAVIGAGLAGLAAAVAAFAGSPGALEALRVDDGTERWLQLPAQLRADLELDHDQELLGPEFSG